MSETPAPIRIKEIAESDYTPEQAEVIKNLLAGRGRLLTPYKVWIHSPKVAEAMEKLGTFLNKKSHLSEREVEFGICIIAQHWASEFVWYAHVKRCIDLGIAQSVMDDVLANKRPKFSAERDEVLYDVAQIAKQPGAGPDEIWDRAVKVLGRDGLADYLCLLGYYSAVAIAMKLHRVPPNK